MNDSTVARHWLRPGLITLLPALGFVAAWMLVARAHDSAAIALAVEGGCEPGSSPFLAAEPELAGGRITYCTGGDADTGVLETAVFAAGTRSVVVMLAGHPNNDTVRLEARDVADGRSHLLEIQGGGDDWRRTTLDIPEPAVRAGFVLRLVDESPAPFGWAGLGTPGDASVLPALRLAASLALAALAGHAWLCLAAWLLPAGWSTSFRLIAALLLLGGTCICLFFLHLGVPALAGTARWAALLAPLAAFAMRRPANHQALRPLLHFARLGMPSLVLSVLILWVGLYPFSGTLEEWTVPASRWRGMPPDNWLPYVLGDMAREGVVRRPMYDDWLSSDRPPMQAGLYLVFHNVWPGSPGALYQAISTWAQCLVLIPAAMLLDQRGSVIARATMLACVGLSALVVFNGLFVWPKLLAATYCGIFHLVLFARPASARHAAVAGLAAGLAMLAHGGALFALAGSAGTFALVRRMRGVVPLLSAIAVAAAAYAPWIHYQKAVDPPGDRLVKWHFAGDATLSDTPLTQALVDAYSTLPFTDWLAGRQANLAMLFDKSTRFPIDAWRLLGADTRHEVLGPITDNSFFHVAYSLWFFSPWLIIPCVVVLWARKRQVSPLLPAGSAMAVTVGLTFWCLVMFTPASTAIHQGGYFSVLLLNIIVMLLVYAASRPTFFILAGLNMLVCIAIYMVDRHPAAVPNGQAYALVALALASCFLASCVHVMRPISPGAPGQARDSRT